MPELPEVETIRRELINLLPFKVKRIEVGPKITWPLKKQEFPWSELEGKKLLSIERKGKWLRFAWGPEPFLLSHLGMTGAWMSTPLSQGPLPAHTHLIFYGEDT